MRLSSTRVFVAVRMSRCRWLGSPMGRRDLHRANLANDHQDDPEYWYRMLADEARTASQAGWPGQ